MKKFFICALAAMAFVACSENNENVNEPNQKGELEQSYVAITLAADDMTRAADGVYDEGLAVERAVKSAHVFFFEDGGKAFPVAFDNGTETTTNTGECNWLQINLTGNATGMNNVSDVKDAVLVIQNYKGEYPDQVVAVLNWTPKKSSYNLSELQTEISQLGSDANGYVMSNSVYAEKKTSKAIDAVSLTVENICKKPEEALKKPVVIHVERVAAKVVFTSDYNGKFEVGTVEDTVDDQEYTVYAQIKGFELYNDYETSYLLKKINPNWADDANFGFTNWNDEDWSRSYWATSLDSAFPENTFAWNTDNTTLHVDNDLTNVNPINYVYCGENTRAWTEAADVRTKVIVKAQLVDANNNSLEVVNWYGKDYIGEGNLLKVVANTLKNTYFINTGTDENPVFTGLAPKDIKCVARNPKDKNAYEVFFVIADASKPLKWHKHENGTYKPIKIEDLNTNLASIQPALVYKNGMTYYWLDIKHLGKEGSTTEFGVVRNHVYKVNISGITGYGTPVYNGNTAYLTPEEPQEVKSFVAAQINILSWRVVENNYEI